MRQPLSVHIVAHSFPGRQCQETRDVWVGLQVGKAHVDLVAGDATQARWETEVSVEVAEDGVREIRGVAVHGSRRDRFLYLAWVGQTDGVTGMFRRAKLPFDAVSDELFDTAIRTGHPLVATLGMTDARGGPVCAAVRPPRIAWTVG